MDPQVQLPYPIRSQGGLHNGERMPSLLVHLSICAGQNILDHQITQPITRLLQI